MTNKNNKGMAYLDVAQDILHKIRQTQMPNLTKAAAICSDSIATGGLVHLFGTGHSRIGVEEMFPRYGSFPGFHPIVELSLSYYTQVIGANGLRQEQFIESLEGFGEIILKNFEFGKQDSFIVFSNSGVNGVVIDVALGARKRDLPVIGVLSVEHCHASEPKHSSGKKLLDIANVVLDNCSPRGDASIQIDGLEQPIAPGSTLGYSIIVNTLRCLIAESLAQRGIKLPVITSSSIVGQERAELLFEEVYKDHRLRTSKL